MKAGQNRESMDNLIADSKEQSVECNLCDMKCDTLTNLQKHMRAFHQRCFSTQTMELWIPPTNFYTNLSM